MQERVIGIDLGTTNSCVATLEDGQPAVIINSEGDRTTPSVISLVEDDVLVGAAARRQAALHPESTIFSIKRFMGRKMEEVESEKGSVSYNITPGEADAVRVQLGERLYSPEELSSKILQKLKGDAEDYLNTTIHKAVVTVPAYFNAAQRKATKQAAEIAGLEVLRLVNEPTAAALAYGFASEKEETVLVFDLGGGTFDVSVLELGGGVFEVKATAGDNHLGGDDFDAKIVDWLVEGFQKQNGIDLRLEAVAMQRLYDAAERAKVELSRQAQTQISLPFITTHNSEPVHLEVELTRATLNSLVMGLLERLAAPTQQVLQMAQTGIHEVDHILLVGGMTRMPAVQNKVKELTGREPLKTVNPDEAVALGAAIQAGIIEGEVADVLLLDVTPLSLGIETKGGITSHLISANTTIPARANEVFTTAQDNQSSVEVHVVQGDRELAHDNRSLGRVQLMGIPPAQAGVPQIEVTFDIDANGILSVTACDMGTDNQQEMRIEATTGLTDKQVGEMRSQANAHRLEDMKRRQEIEARNEAEVAVQQAEQLLRAQSEKMREDERERIQLALTEARDVLEAEEVDVSLLDSSKHALLTVVQTFSARIYGGDRSERQEMATALQSAPVAEGEWQDMEIDVEDPKA